MQYGISVPNFADYADPRALADLARDAEAAGWDGFFLWDHILFDTAWRLPLADPWVALAAVAASTTRVRLGPLVTPLARRRPWKVARETVTLDHLSGGRLILGVGLGYPPGAEFGQFGEETDNRVRARKLDEGLDILTGLWSGEPFAYAGEQYRLQETVFLPRPVQRPRIPIWVAGYWPNRAPFRRAARWDGVCPGSLNTSWDELMPLADLRATLAYIRAHRAGAAPYDVVVGGYTPGDDRAAGAAVVAPYAAAGVTWWIENIHGLRGPFDAMRERVRQGPPAA
ncbi:MAG TPA: LLM class flavin-dependent oxidoreductase [Thermomicrobiales bacterium]|nr:LLM class flavin-dependent oxidoreductase [Thermomicrobiales bacterium]